MKIRCGFVSNSSSSSFAVSMFGIELNDDQIDILKEKLYGKEEDVDDYDLCEYDAEYVTKEFPNIKNIYVTGSNTDDNDYRIFIGRDWKTIGDEETGKQFKESTESSISEILGNKVKCKAIFDSWEYYC